MKPTKESKENNKPKSEPNISFFTLFRFASKSDRVLIAVSAISSILAGLTFPYGITLVADLFQSMISYANNKSNDSEFFNHLQSFAIKYPCVGAVLILGGYLSSGLMEVTAINQVFRIREAYLKATLNQDFSYFDTSQIGDFASRMTDDILKLQEGIGDKLSLIIYFFSTSSGCIVMSFTKGWKLTLLCMASAPVSFLFIGIAAIFAQRFTKQETVEKSKASAVAEEVLSSIRTVYAFNGQEKELDRYRKCLNAARKADLKKELFSGLTTALLFLCIFMSYGLNFYFGVYLIVNEPNNYNVAVMFAVFMGVMQGMATLGMVGSLVGSFASACGAGAHIFNLIDNKPTINPLLDRGLKPMSAVGNIEFRDVMFHYPTRPDITVLKDFNLTLKHGQSVAFVGPSGCGKSTIIRLVSRNYDVVSGQILLDGQDVRDLSVRWLRAQIGLVAQEPVLFNTTVRDNIRYGREGASDSDIEDAARQSNAHQFITKLPKGYGTLVGERGATLSGGQKQRIAIARALINNPTILLLDEATSALDTASEYKVQKALDQAAKGRTTLIVAHRLSTIRNVDVIYVLKDGKVIEQGNHEDLIKAKGLYYDMLSLQQPLGMEKTEDVTDTQLERDDSVKSLQLRTSSVESIADKKLPPIAFFRLFKLNLPEVKHIIIGSVCSCIIGCAGPIYFLLFGNLMGAMTSDIDVLMETVSSFSIACVVIGVIMGVVNVIESLCFGLAGARLTERLRFLMFQHLLRQQIGFFDKQSNATGALCANLSSEAAYVRQAAGQRISLALQGVGAIGLAVIMSMWYEYRLGLIALAFAPLMALVIYCQAKATYKESFDTAVTLEKSTKIAIEVAANVRTVAALGREKKFLEEYVAQLRPALAPAKISAHIRGMVTGMSRGMFNFIISAMFYYGGHLIVYEGKNYEHIIIAAQGMQMAAMTAQSIFTSTPDFQKGINAASRAMALLDTKPTINDPEKAITPFVGTGDASFENVQFRYPTRPGERILRGLNLEMQRGKTVALVGESGCGKSTVISLLQRFYDPESGIVALDKIPLPHLLRKELRATFGLVSQEPVLFSRTIRENIAYGNNANPPTDEEIIMAAKQANIHTFIQALPQGYDSDSGSKGVQLSGGQKQRIAIARALVRRPKILLLDEATSALDTESEKLVQEALNRAKAGRTCVMIAHRLSTVRDADVICVFHHGRIAETGTHDQLMERKGLYYNLHTKGS